MLEKKKVSSDELKGYFSERIKKYNPSINAFITVNDELNAVTEQEDGKSIDKNVENQVRTSGDSPLSGIPLAIKDNFCTKGLRTTAASKVLDQFIPPYDATVTKKLKDAGVTFLGKTNMDAWAHGSSGETSDYGPAKNPWNLEHAPGGSSSGSAAAVASYLAPLAIGSETAGSIRVPASWTGLVGLKPTYGRVSRYGVAAMGSSLDSPGPLSLSVEDAALILECIAGKDLYDATSIDAPIEKYREEMKKGKKFKIGIPKEYFEGVNEEVKAGIESAIKVLEKLGHTIKEVSLLSPKYSISVYTIIQRAEVSSNLARFQGIRYDLGRDQFGNEAKKRTMLGAFTLAHGYHDAYYKKALKVRTLIVNDFKKAFENVDLIAGPAAPMTAIKLGEFVNYPFFGELMDQLNEPSSIAGLPAISIPVGIDKGGLPIGMQMIGNFLRESDLLAAAYQYEQETNFNDVIKVGLDKWKD